MSYGFEIGRTYNRVRDIHAVFNGSRRGGIITTDNEDGTKGPIFIITGNSGKKHGYHDRWREDGAFEYFGEGQVGHMKMNKGNLAIQTHAQNGRSILLFERVKKQGIRFVGDMVYEADHIEVAPDRKKKKRNAIVFELRTLDAVQEKVEKTAVDLDIDLEALKRLAYEAAGVREPRQGNKPRNLYERSADVRNYVLARANGNCEGDGDPAPFRRADGTAYLEPHHIRRVSDGGPDHPGFVIALCPNCHRRAHAAADAVAFNVLLLERMGEIEQAL